MNDENFVKRLSEESDSPVQMFFDPESNMFDEMFSESASCKPLDLPGSPLNNFTAVEKSRRNDFRSETAEKTIKLLNIESYPKTLEEVEARKQKALSHVNEHYDKFKRGQEEKMEMALAVSQMRHDQKIENLIFRIKSEHNSTKLKCQNEHREVLEKLRSEAVLERLAVEERALQMKQSLDQRVLELEIQNFADTSKTSGNPSFYKSILKRGNGKTGKSESQRGTPVVNRIGKVFESVLGFITAGVGGALACGSLLCDEVTRIDDDEYKVPDNVSSDTGFTTLSVV